MYKSGERNLAYLASFKTWCKNFSEVGTVAPKHVVMIKNDCIVCVVCAFCWFRKRKYGDSYPAFL